MNNPNREEVEIVNLATVYMMIVMAYRSALKHCETSKEKAIAFLWLTNYLELSSTPRKGHWKRHRFLMVLDKGHTKTEVEVFKAPKTTFCAIHFTSPKAPSIIYGAFLHQRGVQIVSSDGKTWNATYLEAAEVVVSILLEEEVDKLEYPTELALDYEGWAAMQSHDTATAEEYRVFAEYLVKSYQLPCAVGVITDANRGAMAKAGFATEFDGITLTPECENLHPVILLTGEGSDACIIGYDGEDLQAHTITAGEGFDAIANELVTML